MSSDAYPLDRLRIREHGPRTNPDSEDEPRSDSTLVVLHGWGSRLEDMETLAGPLAESYRVLNVDLPGHGESPPPDTPWGVPEYADLIARILADRGLSSASLLGHSNGGRIGLYMASEPKYAPLIDRLVLIAPSGVTPERGLGYYLRSWAARIAKAPFRPLPEPYRSRALDWLRSTRLWSALGSSDYQAAEGVMRETFVRTVTHHLDENVARIEAPTLIFWGENDPAVSRRQVEFLESHIPDAGLVVLENAGHFAHIDDPATCLSAIRYFLAHSSPSPAA